MGWWPGTHSWHWVPFSDTVPFAQGVHTPSTGAMPGSHDVGTTQLTTSSSGRTYAPWTQVLGSIHLYCLVCFCVAASQAVSVYVTSSAVHSV